MFKAAELRRRVLDVLSGWAGRAVPELEASDLDLAVARGPPITDRCAAARACGFAAAFARSYYVGLETAAPAVPGVAPPIKALCVVPMGMEEGTEADVPGPEIGLIVGEPAQFRFLGSTTRRDDPSRHRPRPLDLRRAPGARSPSKPPWRPMTAARASPCRSGFIPVSPKLAPSKLSCQSTRDRPALEARIQRARVGR